MDGTYWKVECKSTLLDGGYEELTAKRLRMLREFAKAKEEGLFTEDEFRAIKWRIFDISCSCTEKQPFPPANDNQDGDLENDWKQMYLAEKSRNDKLFEELTELSEKQLGLNVRICEILDQAERAKGLFDLSLAGE